MTIVTLGLFSSIFVYLFAIITGIIIIAFVGSAISGMVKESKRVKEETERKRIYEEEKRNREPQVKLNEEKQKTHLERDETIIKDLLKNSKPEMTFAISRIGDESFYYSYYDIEPNHVGSEIEIISDEQFHETSDKTRYANIVVLDKRQVGEISDSTRNKIDDHDDPFLCIIKVENTGERIKARAGAFQKRPWRTFKSYVAGTKFDNRQDNIEYLRFDDHLKVELSQFEGEPAVELWGGQGMVGYIPKDLASEITERHSNGTLRFIKVSNVYKKDGVNMIDILVSVYAT